MEIKTEKEDYYQIVEVDHSLVKEEYEVEEHSFEAENEDIPDSNEDIQLKIQDICEGERRKQNMGGARNKFDRMKGEKDEAVMQAALQEILKYGLSLTNAASIFGIPKSTLHSRLQRVKKELPESQEVPLMMGLKKREMINKFASRQILTMAQEENLVDFLLTVSKLHFGLTLNITRELAYRYAISVNQKVPDSWKMNKKAGKAWAYWFLKRHSEISIRRTEVNSVSRNSSFTRENMKIFFDDLEDIMAHHQFDPSRIFNLDETGLSTVLGPPEVLPAKASKQTERQETITICAFVNAAGQSFPPVYIFPRKRHNPKNMECCFEGSVAFSNEKGLMNAETFLKTIEHFKIQTGASMDDQILLILDNHLSHLSFDAIKFCRENGIRMLTLPSHTNYRTQPLELGVFGPFKTYCASAFGAWISAGKGNRVHLKNIARLSSEPLRKSLTSKNIQAGFMKSGIYPMDSTKSLSFFAPTQAASSPTGISRRMSEDNCENMSTTPFPTEINSTDAISPEPIPEVKIPQEILYEEIKLEPHDYEEHEENKEQEIIRLECVKSEQELIISSNDLVLDLSLPSQALSDSEIQIVGRKKIYPMAIVPLDLSTKSCDQAKHNRISTIVAGSQELEEENKQIMEQKILLAKRTARKIKRKIFPDYEIPKKIRIRSREVPLGEVSNKQKRVKF